MQYYGNLKSFFSFPVEAPKRDSGVIEKNFLEALPILEQGSKKVKANQIFYGVALFLCIMALVFTADMTLPYGLEFLLIFIKVVGTIAIGYFFWMGVVMANWELSGILATRKAINYLLKANPNPM